MPTRTNLRKISARTNFRKTGPDRNVERSAVIRTKSPFLGTGNDGGSQIPQPNRIKICVIDQRGSVSDRSTCVSMDCSRCRRGVDGSTPDQQPQYYMVLDLLAAACLGISFANHLTKAFESAGRHKNPCPMLTDKCIASRTHKNHSLAIL